MDIVLFGVLFLVFVCREVVHLGLDVGLLDSIRQAALEQTHRHCTSWGAGRVLDHRSGPHRRGVVRWASAAARTLEDGGLRPAGAGVDLGRHTAAGTSPSWCRSQFS